MQSAGDVFRRCMEDLDVQTAMRCWAEIAPNMPQPKNDAEALITLHYARTVTKSINTKLRYWSHRWLIDHDLPSGLPDELKSRAERIYPKRVEAVGVSVKSLSAAGAPLAKAIEKAMSDAVAECYADGVKDIVVIRARMSEAYNRTIKG